MKVAFLTLGCKTNQAETRAIREQFLDYGYQAVQDYSAAEIVVINSCLVTHVAERKTRNLIRRVLKSNPQSRIYLCGCYVDVKAKEIIREIPQIYRLIKKDAKLDLASWGIIPQKAADHKKIEATKSEFLKIREFLKVEDGCDQYCHYCIIPYARGPVVSYPLKELVNQAKTLVKRGVREIVLTGINLARYNFHGKELADLLKQLEKIKELKRIRISSLEPNLITEKLIKAIKNSTKTCRHLHIPLQSGSDQILHKMGRPYRLIIFENLLSLLRKEIKGLVVTTDIIVGFPGENEQTIKEGYKNIERLKLNDFHLFRYSPREKTKAYDYASEISEAKLKEYYKKLELLKTKVKKAHQKKLLNKKQEILIQEIRDDYCEGLTSDYLMVRTKLDNQKLGDLLLVTPRKIAQDILFA